MYVKTVFWPELLVRLLARILRAAFSHGQPPQSLGASAAGGSVFTMFTYFWGLGGSGKDVVVGLFTVLFGTRFRNYARTLKKTYFMKESSPESPSPFLAGLAAARWVVVTEVPEKAIVADNLKDITDPRGAELTARDLYASPISFHPFFRLVIMSNHEFKLDKEDTGINRRFTAAVHKKQFKDVPTETHHIQADPSLKARIHRGDFVHELWHLMRYLMPTLQEDIAGDQRILPLFPDQDTALAEITTGKLDHHTLDSLMKDFFHECPSNDATKAEVVRTILFDKLQMKSDAEVSQFLLARGIFKKKNKFQGYAYHFERKNKDVWIKLREHLVPKKQEAI